MGVSDLAPAGWSGAGAEEDGRPGSGRPRASERKSQWIVIAASAAGVLGVQLVSPLLPAMKLGLHLSTWQTGAIISAYSISALLATLPAGLVSDRFGTRRVLWWSLLLFGLSGLATVIVPGFLWLIAMRVVQGVAFGALVPLTIGLLVDVVRPERQGHAQSYRVAAMSSAEFVLPLAAGLIVAVTGQWQIAFLLFAIPVVLAGFARRILPQWQATHVSLPGGQYRRQLRHTARDPLIVALFLVGFVRWWLKYGFFSFMPLYLNGTLHSGAATIGAVIAAQGLLGAVVSSQTGRIGSGMPARAALVCSTIAMGASVASLTLIHQLWWAVAMSMLLGVFDGLVGPLMNGLVGALPPATVRTSVIALSGTGRNLGKAVAPAAIGVIISATGYAKGFAIAGAVGLAAPLYLRPLWAPRVLHRRRAARA